MMSERVNDIFSRIAGRYDLLNSIFSFGIDSRWRKEAAAATSIGKKRYRLLDAAAGTGSLTLAILREAEKRNKVLSVTAMDFNREMLNVAKRRFKEMRISSVKFEQGNAMAMKYANGSFDVVSSAFSLRNFDDIGAFLKEAHRVLRKGGRLVLLEMAVPDKPGQRLFFNAYSNLMKLVGALVDTEAYGWLVESIKKFDKAALMEKLTENGYTKVKIRGLASGVAFLVTAEKKS